MGKTEQKLIALTAEQDKIKTAIQSITSSTHTMDTKVASLEYSLQKLTATSNELPINDEEAYSNMIAEITDQNLRKKNILIVGIPEPQSTDFKERRELDKNEVLKIIKLVSKDITEPAKVVRVGKYKPNEKRAMKVSFDSEESVKILLRSRNMLKNDLITIFSDQTPFQQARFKRLKDEMKRRNANDSFKSILHVIILSETWIKSDEEAKRLQITGYTHYYHYRQNAVGGGVSIFAHNSLKHNFIEELSQDDNHYLWIHLEKLSLDIGAIYKPGRTNVKNFLDTFSLQLDRRKRAVVFGDFNFDLLDPSSSVEDYKDTLTESGFKIINKIDPLHCTRETSQNKSLIDHISTNLKENRFHLAIIESSMSDHKQIYFEIDKYQPQSKPKIGYEAIDYIRFYKLMENNKVDNINENYTEFECKLSQTIKQCKVIKVKILNPPRQDWINRNILDKINQKNILWQKHKNNPKDEGIGKDFIRERNTVAKDIQLMKSNYYLKRFFECKNKPKKMWDLLNSLANNKTKEIAKPAKLKKGDLEVKDGNNICEYFNDFFSTVGLKLAEAIPTKYHSNKTYTSSTTDANHANFGLSNLNLTT
ncbi:jg196, partial [Pararge aegeria aegeria]